MLGFIVLFCELFVVVSIDLICFLLFFELILFILLFLFLNARAFSAFVDSFLRFGDVGDFVSLFFVCFDFEDVFVVFVELILFFFVLDVVVILVGLFV